MGSYRISESTAPIMSIKYGSTYRAAISYLVEGNMYNSYIGNV